MPQAEDRLTTPIHSSPDIDHITWRTVLQMAWPLVIANSFWNLQLTVDRIFLGMLSTEALGAAMAVSGVFWAPMALLQQTAAYVTTFVAQYYGARNYPEMGRAFWQAIYISILGGIAFLGLNFLSSLFFESVGHSPALLKLEVKYFNSLAWSALPTALVAAISGYFTGLGNTRVVIGINFVGLLLNMILDYLLIFGNWGFPALGIEGAGYATALATYGAAIYGGYLVLIKNHEFHKELVSGWRWSTDLMRQYLRFGLPSGFQWALEGLAFTVFLIILGKTSEGDAALAASSISMTVMMLAVLPALGIAQSVMSLVGQSLGADRPEQAVRATWLGVRVTFIYIATVALTFILFPNFYLSWFENTNNPLLWQQTLSLSQGLLKIIAVFVLLDSLYFNFSFALKGAGDTRFVSLVALIMPWPILVAPAYFVREWESATLWAWSFAIIYSLVIVSILFFRFKQGKWKSMRVMQANSV